MLNIIVKSAAYILIDTEYLIQRIAECDSFYQSIYPDKQLRKYSIYDILECMISSTAFPFEGEVVNVVFLYKLGNSYLNFQDNTLDIRLFRRTHPVIRKNNPNISFVLTSVYADPEGDELAFGREFDDLIKEVAYKKEVKTIILCTEGSIHNDVLTELDFTTSKHFQIFRNLDYEIGLDYDSENFLYAVMDYVLAICMGLDENEW